MANANVHDFYLYLHLHVLFDSSTRSPLTYENLLHLPAPFDAICVRLAFLLRHHEKNQQIHST